MPPDSSPPDTAILFLTHYWTESVAYRFARLRREVGAQADCYVLLDNDHGKVLANWKDSLRAMRAPGVLAIFDGDTLPDVLGYPFHSRQRIMGNTHFPMMAFARKRPYRYYWQLESDVEYRGNWGDFFSRFAGNDADLLAEHYHRVADWPTWSLWSTLHIPANVPLARSAYVKAFMAVMRLSARAIDAVEAAHRDRWSGHFEPLIPTVLQRQGLRMEDLQSVVPSYVAGSQNPQRDESLQSSVRWRPPVPLAEFTARGNGPLLFHPVKENWAFDGEKVVHWPEPATVAWEPRTFSQPAANP